MNATGYWEQITRQTVGELRLRLVLTTRLNKTVAVRAATGWGNDYLLTFENENGTRTGFVWILRWDDATNASQFARAMTRFLREDVDGVALYDPTGGLGTRFSTFVWGGNDKNVRVQRVDKNVRVQRVSNGVVVITTGESAFRQSVTIEGNNSIVFVSLVRTRDTALVVNRHCISWNNKFHRLTVIQCGPMKMNGE